MSRSSAGICVFLSGLPVIAGSVYMAISNIGDWGWVTFVGLVILYLGYDLISTSKDV